MKYLVAYVIKGAAREWHIETSTALAERFNLLPVYPHIPPHATFKAPFEIEDIEPVRVVLADIAAGASPSPVTMTGIDHFNKRVLFAGVYFSKEGQKVIKDLRTRLREIPGLPFAPQDNSTRFHATLCRFTPPEQCADVLAFAKERAERFDMTFDHIALLQKPEKQWEVKGEFYLGTRH